MPGSRLKEEEFAELYDVSRGPVREAFRLLERRGFVEIVPRHGARVRVFDPADLAACSASAPCCSASPPDRPPSGETRNCSSQLAPQVARLRRSAETMELSPREHATIAGDNQHLIARFSANRPLLRMLEELSSRALWRMAWRDTPLDFTTRARRQQSARRWSELLKAMKSGDAEDAEHLARALLEASRDHMIAAMASPRAVSVAAE